MPGLVRAARLEIIVLLGGLMVVVLLKVLARASIWPVKGNHFTFKDDLAKMGETQEYGVIGRCGAEVTPTLRIPVSFRKAA